MTKIWLTLWLSNLLNFLQDAKHIRSPESCISLQRLMNSRGYSSKWRLPLSPRDVSRVFQWMFHHFSGLMWRTLPWSCGSFPNELDETKWGAHYRSMQMNDSDSKMWRKLQFRTIISFKVNMSDAAREAGVQQYFTSCEIKYHLHFKKGKWKLSQTSYGYQ